jgi:hypothetical protein
MKAEKKEKATRQQRKARARRSGIKSGLSEPIKDDRNVNVSLGCA